MLLVGQRPIGGISDILWLRGPVPAPLQREHPLRVVFLGLLIAILTQWMDQGKIARLHPYHLIFSIWALTQHYADLDVQVRAILGDEDPFEGAEPFIDTLYRKLLTP